MLKKITVKVQDLQDQRYEHKQQEKDFFSPFFLFLNEVFFLPLEGRVEWSSNKSRCDTQIGVRKF